MDEAETSREQLILEYKSLLQDYLAKRPSGMRKRIADAIGSNRSFASQITSPSYRVPIPTNNVHKIMDVCHFSPVERMNFLAAYLRAHPGQAELLASYALTGSGRLEIDLSAVEDEKAKRFIAQTLKAQAEAMISFYLKDYGTDAD